MKPRPPRAGLVAGGVGALVALASLSDVARLPFGLLVLDLALAWGFVSLARALLADDAPWDGLVAALAPYVVVSFLVRRVAHASGTLLPVPLRASILFEAGVLAAALLAFVALRRRIRDRGALVGVGVAGAVVVVALAARIAALPPAPARGDATIIAIALALAGVLFAAQGWGARRLGGRFAALASPAALAIAAGQLLDGSITYFSVVDPLGIASADYREQIALSAFVLDAAGPAYVALKWIVALAAGYAVAHDKASARFPERRFGVALLLVYFGLQPGFFSGTQLL